MTQMAADKGPKTLLLSNAMFSRAMSKNINIFAQYIWFVRTFKSALITIFVKQLF